MSETTIEGFVERFFSNLKCEVNFDGSILIVENIPKSFEDIYGRSGPYKFCFEGEIEGVEKIIRGGTLLSSINRYLEGSGKTTLLKIDFDVDPLKEIENAINFKNCDVLNVTRKHRNNFFSRFTFSTTFRYLNESEQIINEIYVHEGKVVDGDLSGYNVAEGIGSEASKEHLEKDYSVAKELLKEKLKVKTGEMGELLKVKLEEETARINLHYDSQLGELGGDLNSQLKKINEIENKMKLVEGEEFEDLVLKRDRIRKSLIKIGDDDSKDRILKEQEFTLRDAQHKYTLNIDNKMINTTIIYYPVFVFDLYLKGNDSARLVQMSYDPLVKEFDKVSCDTCRKKVTQINLCTGGHIACDECFGRCSECSGSFCGRCLRTSCSSCGRPLCKNCTVMCLGCGKSSCKSHMRTDGVTGEERCVSCLRACMRCHGLSNPKYFGESLDGSKVCGKCLGSERRNKVIKNVFRN